MPSPSDSGHLTESIEPSTGVVIAAHNASATLARTIDSVKAQIAANFVCAIVDDGSDDGTLALARRLVVEDPRFIVLSQGWQGVSVARNRGLVELPRSVEYVTFLDGDDVWTVDALAQLEEACRRQPGLVGAHGLGQFINADDTLIEPGRLENYGRARVGCAGGSPHPWPLGAPTTFETLLIRCTVFPPGLVLARRDLYHKVGGFDPSLTHGEDWDMLIRLSRLGDFAFVNRVLIYHRRGGGATSNDDKMRLGNALVQRRTFWSRENAPAQQALVRDAWHAIQLLHGKERARRARQAFADRNLLAAASEGARVALAAVRYIHGRPRRLREEEQPVERQLGSPEYGMP